MKKKRDKVGSVKCSSNKKVAEIEWQELVNGTIQQTTFKTYKLAQTVEEVSKKNPSDICTGANRTTFAKDKLWNMTGFKCIYYTENEHYIGLSLLFLFSVHTFLVLWPSPRFHVLFPWCALHRYTEFFIFTRALCLSFHEIVYSW